MFELFEALHINLRLAKTVKSNSSPRCVEWSVGIVELMMDIERAKVQNNIQDYEGVTVQRVRMNMRGWKKNLEGIPVVVHHLPHDTNTR